MKSLRDRIPRSAAVVFGGAGFVGSNLAHRLASHGEPVCVYDNLSRPGVELNAEWLKDCHPDLVTLVVDDVRNSSRLCQVLAGASSVFHMAAQVAVTTSLDDPRHDFEVNLRGTLEILEALRGLDEPPPLVFTSTNKVYGCLDDVELVEESTRWRPRDTGVASHGIDEGRPLAFRSPYGCSKGAADQYVLDYAATFGLPAAVFRMSCIYGPRQLGTEDQGWVAHFLMRALAGEPITIFGDGKQVRDVLFVDDLVDALLLARSKMSSLRGRAFNIGGGPGSSVSLLEVLAAIEALHGNEPEVTWSDWRPADQRYFASDIGAFHRATGWRPKVSVSEGLRRLSQWLIEHGVAGARTGTHAPATQEEEGGLRV